MQANRSPTQSAILAMASLEQIQQDLQILPQEALNQVHQFIQLLKKDSQPSQATQTPQSSSIPTVPTPDYTDWSDLIGCISAEEDLSVNYKAYLAEGLEKKYGHR